jgi:glycosyltransferase involved in cell wall biosynthesis
MNVLILAPYPRGAAPSQRFRFEQYIDALAERGIRCTFQSFWDNATWEILYKKGHAASKLFGFARGWLRRFALIFSLRRFDVVLIHREAAPLGPPLIEWLIAKVFRKKIIYDFDDAIWLPNVSSSNKLAAYLKWHSKVASICRWSWKVSCGNAYLADYARRYNPNVVVVPTTVDTSYHQGVGQTSTAKNNVVVGWTGSLSTNVYLESLEDVLSRLAERCDFEFVVISNQPPLLRFPHRFVKWSKDTEVEDLAQLSIGVMPLPADEWSKGKCGFKLIQYLSLGIPAVASPVGVNPEIVLPSVTGFLATTPNEWTDALAALIKDEGLRQRLGENGRRHIEQRYSVNATKETYVRLFG